MSSLTDSRVRHGAKACVDAVRADYPKFNKCLLSQCEAPEKYGVQLVPDAAAAIKALDAPKNRVERRKKTNRYYFRLTDGGAALMLSMLAFGADMTNEAVVTGAIALGCTTFGVL